MMKGKEIMSEDIVEAVLTYLSSVKGVGDELEMLPVRDYDRLEDDLCKVVENVLKGENRA
jgi:hypothetical protein